MFQIIFNNFNVINLNLAKISTECIEKCVKRLDSVVAMFKAVAMATKQRRFLCFGIKRKERKARDTGNPIDPETI